MKSTAKDDFEQYLKEWYETVKDREWYTPADSQFNLQFISRNLCYSGEHGRYSDDPHWLLQHTSSGNREPVWMVFQSEDEAYYWTSRYLARLIRQYRILDEDEELRKQTDA